jgi:hypothetical protein
MQALLVAPRAGRCDTYEVFPEHIRNPVATPERDDQLLRRERRRLTRLIEPALERAQVAGTVEQIEFAILPNKRCAALRRVLLLELCERFPQLEYWADQYTHFSPAEHRMAAAPNPNWCLVVDRTSYTGLHYQFRDSASRFRISL